MSLEPRVDVGILAERLQRLLRLDTSVFDEVRDDPSATVPAVAVLVASTVLAGIGGLLWWIVQDFGDTGEVFMESVVFGSVFSIALWIVWLLVAWVILTQVFQEEADWQQMLRTMGLASIPLALMALLFIPAIDFGIGLASVALLFGLTTLAIHAVTPANPARVLVANLAGFAVWAIVLGLLSTGSSQLAPGIFLIESVAEAVGDFSTGPGLDFDISDLSE
jgi:hypothetical protein